MKRGPGTVPLDRAISKLGLASRADARRSILAGRVEVDGYVVLDPHRRVVPERIEVRIDGVSRRPRAWRFVALHKPRGVVTSRRDQQGRRTVFDLLGADAVGLVAVGRLDLASTGLLLLTTDTQLANALTDPASRVSRRYVVTVRGRVMPATAASLERGLDVRRAAGGKERLTASRVEIRKASGRETHLIVELHEGRNREIRRLFEAVGHEVTRLHRVAFGTIELGDLGAGEWRELLLEDFAAVASEPAF